MQYKINKFLHKRLLSGAPLYLLVYLWKLEVVEAGAEPGRVEGGQLSPLARQKNSRVAFKF